MSLGALQLLWILGAPLLLGALLLRALGLRPRDDRLAFVGLAWPAGCLALAALLLAYLALGVESNLWFTAPVFGGLLLGLLAVRRLPPPSPAPTPAGNHWVLAAVLLGGAAIVVWILAGGNWPCIENDEGNIWSLKAKSLLVDWGPGFAAAQVHNLHPDYPQLNPLLQAWVMSQLGGIVQFENRLPVQLAMLSLWLVLLAALRRRLPPWLSLPLAAVLLLAPEFQDQCRRAMADGLLALGLLVALDGWQRGREAADPRPWHRLAALGLGVALWSKNEAAMYAVGAALAAVTARLLLPRPRPPVPPRAFVPLLLPLLLVAAQVAFNQHFGLRSDLLGANPSGRSMFALMLAQWPERVPVLLQYGASVLLDPAAVQGVLLVALLALPLWPSLCLQPLLAMPGLALLVAVVGVHVVYVGSFLELRMHLDTSYRRVLFQLVPAALLWFGVLLQQALARHRAAAQVAEVA